VSTGPVRVALVKDHPVVLQGLRALLAPYSQRVRALELLGPTNVGTPIDLALYDPFAAGADEDTLTALLANPVIARVAIYSWDVTADRLQAAFERGVAGWLSKAWDAAELIEALEAVHAGQRFAPRQVPEGGNVSGDWPGRMEGLTAREAEVITLITQGLNNNEIAEQTYLSINTVKSYIRSAYRTMGVTSRSQAVLWGLDHGLRPEPQPGV
jgi:two-component system, NarL family, response regulator LiaR